ncbi:unnamed protein product [Caenorhabditis sp. 36 PRJEB53466]|nr:unnamed protein product [Caenorhabditis sp. 36 PRJEB53466]
MMMMQIDSSSPSSCSDSLDEPSSLSMLFEVPLNFLPTCQVCAQPAHGNHFGAISCRACAAFFRRAATGAKTIYKCKKDNSCEIWRNGRFSCKKCRLVRCQAVGMDPNKFQFDRDPISTTEQFTNTKQGKRQILWANLPETVEHFLCRPHFILFMEPTSSMFSDKNFIDCQYLIEKACDLLAQGAAKPIFAKNHLEKLALGLNLVRDQPITEGEMQVIRKLGKDEAMTFWERDFLAVARWLTYFDDFHELPHAQQVSLLKAVWHVWGRLDKLALTAVGRRRNLCKDKMVMLGYNSLMDVKNVELDISWFTKYKKEQLGFFFDELEDFMMTEMLNPLMELEPTDIELTYMLCQLCFHYAGKRFEGEMRDVMEKFQDTLANNLHDYYVNELRMPRYCGRLNQMLKINNMIQRDIWEKRAKHEIAKVFNVFCVEFSHPEMFQDCAS